MTNESVFEAIEAHLEAAKDHTPEAVALIAACELLLYLAKVQHAQIEVLRKHTYGAS